AIHDIAFHPSNLIIATATENHDIRLYDLSSTQRKSFKWLVDSYPIWSTAFHPSGQYLFAGTAHSALRIFDVQNLKCFSTVVTSASDETAGGVSNGISCVRPSPDGRFAVTSTLDGNIRLFDVVSGQCVSTWRAAHNGHRVTSLSVSKSGAYALSSGEDGTVRLWELSSGRTLKVYYSSATTCPRRPGPAASIVPGPRASFSHDEQHIIGTSKAGVATAWDCVTGSIVTEFGSSGTVCSLANPIYRDSICWNQDGDVAYFSSA
ncbi:WD40-repeat-containing domain protein, partial [Catenaria anguillulae PL171]